MRVRIYTPHGYTKDDLKTAFPDITVLVPVGERKMVDVYLTDRNIILTVPITQWAVAHGMTYEVFAE